MGNQHIDRWKTASWFMRGCYVLTLVVVAVICVKFYIEQSDQNSHVGKIRALVGQFEKTDAALKILADKAERIGAETPEKVSNPRVETLLRGKSLTQRRQILANQPLDPEIIHFQKTLLFHQSKARIEVESLNNTWDNFDSHLTAVILSDSRFMKQDEPFKAFYSMLSVEKVEAARTKADIHWVAREIFAAYDNIVTVSINQAVESLYNHDNRTAHEQGELLEKFLLLTLGAISILVLLVFLPLDIFVHRMMRRVAEKTEQADRHRWRLEILADINADWTWEMDENLRFSYFSSSFEKVTNVNPQMLLGKTRKETGIPGMDPEVFEEHLRQLDCREPFTDLTHSRKNAVGADIWLSVSGSPIFDTDHRFIGYLGIGRDVTETVMRELELDEARLRAQSADRVKSEFLANMSHEIRTPMSGVMGMAELLVKSKLDPKQKTFADIIVKSGEALLTIINDILDFSKIDAGQLELSPAPFALADAIEDVATLVSSKVAEKDLELLVRIAPNLPDMYVGDVGRLRQIVTNLLGNAVKFTEQGQIFIDVDGAADENGNTRLSFRIEDTGIGIPAETCERVFEKFSQVDSSATRKHEGTGLGLSISSSLVKLMGGEIGVESEIDKGSTFWFEVTLPVYGGAKRKKIAPVEAAGARVLIVDGNDVNRSILSEQMANWHFDAAAAASGEEALAVLRAAADKDITPDILLVDYHLPDMNGGELSEIIRSDTGFKEIPVIMLTTVDKASDARSLHSMGVHSHLVRPVRSSLMLDAITRVLQQNRTGGKKLNPGIGIAKSVGAAKVDDVGRGTRIIGATRKPVNKPKSQKDVDRPEVKHVEVLVAEDNEVNQLVFSQVLQAAGISFVIVTDGQQALNFYDEHNPKIICMDVSMPVMDGYDATHEIRRRERNTDRHIPIIGITAHAVEGDKEKCLESGMDDYLSKPVSPHLLEEKIRLWLDSGERATKVA